MFEICSYTISVNCSFNYREIAKVTTEINENGYRTFIETI